MVFVLVIVKLCIFFFRFTNLMKLSLVILCIAFSEASTMTHKLLKPNMPGYYLVEFSLNTIVSYLIVAVLPKFVAKACGHAPGPKYKRP